MAKYKFQFKTGRIYDGPIEVQVRDFIAEFEGEITPALALTIEARGGQLVPEPKAKKRKVNKVNPIKWADKEGK